MNTYQLIYTIRGAKPFFTPASTPTSFQLRIGFPITPNTTFHPQHQAVLQYEILRNNNRILFKEFESMQGAFTDSIITNVLQAKGWLPTEPQSVVLRHFEVLPDEFIALLKTFVHETNEHYNRNKQ